MSESGSGGDGCAPSLFDMSAGPVYGNNGRPAGQSASEMWTGSADAAERDVGRARSRHELLTEVTGRLLATEDPQAIVDYLARNAMAVLGCDVFFNYLADPRQDRLHLNACAGIPDEAARELEWLDYGVAICGCAARDRCRIVAENIPDTPDPRTELVKSLGLTAYACHPLLAGGALIGTLSFGSRTKLRFTADELSLMQTVAYQVAIAMERLRAHEALRESATVLRLTLGATGIGTLEYRPQTGECSWDAAAKAIWGLPPEAEVRYPQVLDAIHPQDRSRVTAILEASLQNETAEFAEAEYRVIWPDGSVHWILARSHTLFEGEGERRHAARVIGVHQDISGRKRAEQQLATAMQRLNAHMDNSPLAVIEFDPQFRVTRWSKEAEKLFGWRAEEILGRAMAEIAWVYEDDVQIVRDVSQDMLDGKRARNVSVNRNYCKDGSIVECEWYNSAIYDENGRLASILSQVLNITEKRRTEERLSQAQKMESIALLAGGLAHDFNNLLVGVIGNGSLALEMLPAGSPAADALGRVVKSGEQAAHLTRQMLAYAGRGQFVVEPVDLSEVVREVTDLVASTAPKKVAIELELEPKLPAIEADRAQIHQVLMNLVINATEAIGDHAGLIVVQTGTQLVDEQFRRELEAADVPSGHYVFLEVRDNGCGMDAPTKAKILDPFFTTKFQGRGLGLAAVAGIVRAHKGAIRVRSAPGRGTSFLVLFPALNSHAPESAALRRRQAEELLNAGGRVLVIDDEKLVRDTAALALEARGCSVLSARSGAEAISVLEHNAEEVSLVILDLSMPGMSGQEVLPKLLEISPRLKVIVSSGYTEADALKLFEGMPVAGFIQKPYTVQQLADKVRGISGTGYEIPKYCAD